MTRLISVILLLSTLMLVSARAQLMFFGVGAGNSSGPAGPGCTTSLDFTDGCGTILIPALIH